MNLDRIRKSLRRWHLATVVITMTSASAGISLALLGPEAWLPIPALVGWAIPLVLHGFLRRASESVRAKPTHGGLAIGAVFLGMVLIPVMVQQTARRIGDAIGEPRLAARQGPVAAVWIIAHFLPLLSGLLGFGWAYALTGILQTMTLALMTASLQRAVVDHVEMSEGAMERVGDGAGHRVPVAVRS